MKNDAQDKGRDGRNDAQDKGQNLCFENPSLLPFIFVCLAPLFLA